MKNYIIFLFRNPLLTFYVTIHLLLLSGCVTSSLQTESLDHVSRAETKTERGVQVSAVVLSPWETQHIFNLPLDTKGIQPVWIKIENRKNKKLMLLMLSLDPEYFSPSEVAWKFRSYNENDFDSENDANETRSLDDLIEYFLQKHVPIIIPPNSTVSGFVYTNLDPGVKAFAVELVGGQAVYSFEFVQYIPGFEADFMKVDFSQIYKAAEVRDTNLEGLRDYLEKLSCCVLGGDQKSNGDPLNLVFVGNGQHILSTLIRRGWDITETIRSDTIWRTITSSLFGLKYRTSPVSPLYLFGRHQDVALQKARHTVDERNHMRLWLAPITLNGEKVWVGQISRDIGVKLSSKTITTHKIDPVVDEARLYISQDLAASHTLQAFGYVKGVGYSDRHTPHFNYTNDPYYTDGLRVLLILSNQRRSLENIKNLQWEQPGRPVISARKKAKRAK